jgi:hypothetical protein
MVNILLIWFRGSAEGAGYFEGGLEILVVGFPSTRSSILCLDLLA